MGNFALLYCMPQGKTQNKKVNLVKRIFQRIMEFLRRKKTEEWVKDVELKKELPVYFIKLPYTLDGISTFSLRKITNLKSEILQLCSEKNIKYCYISDDLKSILRMDGDIIKNCDGRRLFEVLLLEILKMVCQRRKRYLCDLDITFIAGKEENDKKLEEGIGTISNSIKYITVLTKRKDDMLKRIDSLFDDTGLSVRVSQDPASSLKNADIIINFGCLNSYMKECKIKPESVFINYGDVDGCRITEEALLVNGIEIELPAYINHKLDTDIFSSFSKLELAGIFLTCFLTLENNIAYSLDEHIREGFQKEGIEISGIQGRHSTIKITEI